MKQHTRTWSARTLQNAIFLATAVLSQQAVLQDFIRNGVFRAIEAFRTSIADRLRTLAIILVRDTITLLNLISVQSGHYAYCNQNRAEPHSRTMGCQSATLNGTRGRGKKTQNQLERITHNQENILKLRSMVASTVCHWLTQALRFFRLELRFGVLQLTASSIDGFYRIRRGFPRISSNFAAN